MTSSGTRSSDRKAGQKPGSPRAAAKLAKFDLQATVELAGAVRDCRSGLSEAAEYDALFHAHSRPYNESHYDAELAYCGEVMALIQTMLPEGTTFPPVGEFFKFADELVCKGLLNICSYRGDAVQAVVGHEGASAITIEAATGDEWRCTLAEGTPICVFRSLDGARTELTVIVPEQDGYDDLFGLLESGVEELASD